MTLTTLQSLSNQIRKGNNREILLSEDTVLLLQIAIDESKVKKVTVFGRFSNSENMTINFVDMGIEHLLNTTRKHMASVSEKSLQADEIFFGLMVALLDKVCLNMALVAEEAETAK